MKEGEMSLGGDTPAVVAERIHWTQAELVAEATARFGDDPKRWAFQCPNCGDIACAQDWLDAGVPVADIAVGQECIGRATGALAKPEPTNTRGCDWCAYGLFRGPWLVTVPDGWDVGSFRLAPVPAGHTEERQDAQDHR
jgi:hypothetical protein